MVHRTVFRRLLELEHELFGVLCDIPLACCLFFSVYIFLWGASFPICVAIFFVLFRHQPVECRMQSLVLHDGLCLWIFFFALS